MEPAAWMAGVFFLAAAGTEGFDKRVQHMTETVAVIRSGHPGMAEPLPLPEGAAARVGLQHGQVETGAACLPGQLLAMLQQRPPVPGAAGAFIQQHQAEIGIPLCRKAKRQFCQSRQPAIQEQAQPETVCRVAAGRPVGEEARGLLRIRGPAFGQQPIVLGVLVKADHRVQVACRSQGADLPHAALRVLRRSS